jgi:DMSO/TMAO reductase YedYZ molybdopterin-dependent catalytic subunit
MPSVELPVTMECAGNGRAKLQPRPVSQPWLGEAIGTGLWTGTPLRGVLDGAGLLDDAVEVVFTGLDHGLEGGVEQDYARSLSLADAMREEVLLVWALEGQPLPPQHGFPLRLIVPGWYGMTNVKWLGRITAVAEPFAGYQQASGYRYRSEPEEVGEPVQRIVPRAMMVPPGYPEFMSRSRRLPAGPCRIEGRAWSGRGAITRVEVSVDGGATWEPAQLGEPPSPFAWAPWSFTWEATPGEHELCCRATDETGTTQPDDPSWNVGGYSNNAIQRVPVTVEIA